jgi:hypothetical protein
MWLQRAQDFLEKCKKPRKHTEAKITNTFKVGDKVRYSSEFLRNTGQYTGPTPQLKGTVTKVSDMGGKQLVSIKWNDGTEGKALSVNLWPIGKWEPN